MGTNDNKIEDALMIQKLMETWKKNNRVRKSNEFQLIQDTVNAMMLPQIEAIQDRQENTYNRYQSNINQIRKSHLK